MFNGNMLRTGEIQWQVENVKIKLLNVKIYSSFFYVWFSEISLPDESGFNVPNTNFFYMKNNLIKSFKWIL